MENSGQKTVDRGQLTEDGRRKMEYGACENCEHSIPAGGLKTPALVCNQKANADIPLQVVKPHQSCTNFVRSRELAPPHLAAALAEGAKLIPLTKGKFAIVDAEDYELLNRYKWHVNKGGRTYYARSQEKGKPIRMHRLITDAPKGLFVDHINHNGLDNRKKNLRLCTRTQNARNRLPRRGGFSKYKGVSWNTKRKVFIAAISVGGKKQYLGYFDDQIKAAKAYDKKAKELFGEFAYLNFPND